MSGKIVCIVDGCARGMNPETALRRWGSTDISLICEKHWRNLTASERRVWSRIRRVAKRIGWDAIEARQERIWVALARRAAGPRIAHELQRIGL